MDSKRNPARRRWGGGLVVGLPGASGVTSRGGMTWSTTGRADVSVDVDIDRQHGRAATG